MTALTPTLPAGGPRHTVAGPGWIQLPPTGSGQSAFRGNRLFLAYVFGGMTPFRRYQLIPLGATLLLLTLLAVLIVEIRAQSTQSAAPRDELFSTIASLDSALFATASYDRCDVEKFKTFFADDVEFYHDQSGLTVGSQTVAEQVQQNICGKVRRELVAGTLQVYPMHGYGAVETGVHRFYQPKTGSEATGEAKFIHLWQNKDGAWRITRVISYDHVALKK